MARRWEEVKADRRRADARRHRLDQETPRPHPTHEDPADPDYPKPVVSPRTLERWRGYRVCVKVDGGHFWHAIGFVDWECCQCGIQTDGAPQDGQRAGIWV